jgi:hypothetical protein
LHPQQSPGEPSPQPFPFQVLVRVPEARNIPIFAMGVERERAAVEDDVMTGHDAVKRAVSGNIARALAAGNYGAHQIIHRRVRVEGRTAIHSVWLAVAEARSAQAFPSDYPRLGLDAIERQTAAALLRLEARIDGGLIEGRFDLGRLDTIGQLRRAREYVSLSTSIETLRSQQQALIALKQGLQGEAL